MSNSSKHLEGTNHWWPGGSKLAQWGQGLWRKKSGSKDEINKSGLSPAGRAVLVKPYEPEITKGVIIIPDTVKEGHRMREVRGTVVAVGPEAWKDEDQPRAVPGDKVLVSQWVGVVLQGTWDGEWYRMVNGEDIYCVVERENPEVATLQNVHPRSSERTQAAEKLRQGGV